MIYLCSVRKGEHIFFFFLKVIILLHAYLSLCLGVEPSFRADIGQLYWPMTGACTNRYTNRDWVDKSFEEIRHGLDWAWWFGLVLLRKKKDGTIQMK